MTGKIRLANIDDGYAISEIYKPIVLESRISFELNPPTEEEMKARIRTTLEKYPWIVYEKDEIIGGYAYAGLHRERGAYQWSVETSVYMHPSFKRKRIANDLYRVLFDILKKQGFCRAIAGITQPNVASTSFHKAFGFEEIGIYHKIGFKQGEWCDVMWLEKDINDAKGPGRVITLAELQGSGNLEQIFNSH